MGRSLDGADAFNEPNPEELPEHPVAVPAFALDRYEVTVARFRAFVRSWQGQPIPENAGAHPAVPGSGWQPEWDAQMPRTSAVFARSLRCDEGRESWSEAPGLRDESPMGCVTWYEAYAFCTWDGGRLPIETEWERVASGDENRVYPWGFGGPDCARVRPYDNCHEQRDIFAPVGRLAAGAGPWGHLDLAGGAKEWIRDVFDRYVIGNPAPAVRLRLPGGVSAPHVLRGLSFWGGDGDMRSADRTSSSPETRHPRNGIRCARDVSLAR